MCLVHDHEGCRAIVSHRPAEGFHARESDRDIGACGGTLPLIAQRGGRDDFGVAANDVGTGRARTLLVCVDSRHRECDHGLPGPGSVRTQRAPERRDRVAQCAQRADLLVTQRERTDPHALSSR